MEKIENLNLFNEKESERREWEKEIDEIRKLKAQYFKLKNEKIVDDAEFNAEGQRVKELFEKKFLDAGISDEEARKVVSYHFLIGSTPEFEKHKQLDFEGDLSIRKFFEEEIARYQAMP